MLNPFLYYKKLGKQKANRLALAQYLEDHVTDNQYDHSHCIILDSKGKMEKGCALGYAYEINLGNCASNDVKECFGKFCFERIFDYHGHIYFTRKHAIDALRTYPIFGGYTEARFR